MKIGVAISTYGRPEVFERTYEHMKMRLPKDAELIVVSDAHEDAPEVSDYIFRNRAGIPRVKNKCLELLIDRDCDQLFLFDDDIFPTRQGWWRKYVAHKEPHLMYIFTGFGNQTKGIKEVYRDDDTVAYDHVRGCMLYYDRKVIDAVGGFDTEYGLGMYEHTDLTNRIYNAGLTTHRIMDIPDSDRMFWSLDELEEVDSTFTQEERKHMIRTNKKVKMRNSKSKEYKDFR